MAGEAGPGDPYSPVNVSFPPIADTSRLSASTVLYYDGATGMSSATLADERMLPLPSYLVIMTGVPILVAP